MAPPKSGSRRDVRWEAHQHAIRLAGPAFALPVLGGGVTAAVVAVPGGAAQAELRLAVVVAGVAALSLLVVAPVARWSRYRVVLGPDAFAVREGVLRTSERVVPLSRVAEVLAVQSALGRLLGHGSLVLVPVEGRPLRAEHVPRVLHLQHLVLGMAEAAGAGSGAQTDDRDTDDEDIEDEVIADGDAGRGRWYGE